MAIVTVIECFSLTFCSAKVKILTIRQILLLLLFPWSLLLSACGEDDGIEFSPKFFGASPGTTWTFVSSFSDTTIWEFTQVKIIEGQNLAEIGITQEVTNFSYFSQSGNTIFKHAQILPKLRFELDDFAIPILSDNDTLIFFSEPSVEYVINQEMGFKWTKKALILSTQGYTEITFQMEVIGKETLETPAGIFNCDVIEDEFGNIEYVSPEGVVMSKPSNANFPDVDFTETLVSIAQ